MEQPTNTPRAKSRAKTRAEDLPRIEDSPAEPAEATPKEPAEHRLARGFGYIDYATRKHVHYPRGAVISDATERAKLTRGGAVWE